MCENRRLIYENRLHIFSTLPPGRPGLLSRSPPVFGMVMGELIYLIKCKTVDVQLRPTETCFADIPVTFRGNDLCLDPSTKIL